MMSKLAMFHMHAMQVFITQPNPCWDL